MTDRDGNGPSERYGRELGAINQTLRQQGETLSKIAKDVERIEHAIYRGNGKPSIMTRLQVLEIDSAGSRDAVAALGTSVRDIGTEIRDRAMSAGSNDGVVARHFVEERSKWSEWVRSTAQKPITWALTAAALFAADRAGVLDALVEFFI